MIKTLFANIPFYAALPIELVIKVLSYVVNKLVYLGGTLHIKMKTPTGVKLIRAEQELRALQETAKQLQEKFQKSAVKNNVNTSNRLVNIISNGGNSDPTFH
jgi:hypothetical protein